MSYLHDDIDDDTAPHTAYQEPARELTLSTGTILGIFFGLALLCAVFFGFGYSMGSKSRQAPVIAADTSTPGSTNFNTFKPAPGAPASQAAPANTAPKPIDPAPPVTVSTAPSEPAPIVRTNTPPPAAPIKPAEPAETPSAPLADGSSVVQVAAVSHQEDADLLVTALKRKGYSVVARTEPQDKLFHIQVGPFASKKDAEAMRQRLLADGYNAIVK